MNPFEYPAYAIGLLGMSVICWGVLVAAVRFVQLEAQRFRGANICHPRSLLRHHLGSYLLLGLEFLVAADIIYTLFHPSLTELAVLGSIVAIRTVLNFFLAQEMRTHDCTTEGQPAP